MEYIQLTLDDYIQCKTEIKENLGGIVKGFVRIGWQLTRINNSQAYKHDGYNTIAEFAKAEYGMNPSGVSRFMSVYERYSLSGDTPELKEQYRDFNFSQLTEMLQLSEEDRAMILPEAGKEDIRELKRFNKENEYNPDALTNWQQETEEPLKNAVLEFFRERKEALNALYESEAYRENNIEEMKAIVRCGRVTFKKNGVFLIMYNENLFVKNKNERHCDVTWEEFFSVVREVFDGSAAGGCTWENYFKPECQNNAYESEKTENETAIVKQNQKSEYSKEENTEQEEEKGQKTAIEEQIPGQKEIGDYPEVLPVAPAQMNEPEKTTGCIHRPEFQCALPEAAQEEPEHSLGNKRYNPLFIRDYLEKEGRNLKEYLTIEDMPMVVVMKQEALVKGMQILLKEAEAPEEIEETEEPVQPPLPLMKNNDQRRGWLRSYKDWGLWYKDEHIGARYYKYDFENGARLIAEVYITPKNGNIPEFESCYIHLVGGPEAPKGTNGIGKWSTHKTYDRYPHSETELVEFLKEVQKKGKDR